MLFYKKNEKCSPNIPTADIEEIDKKDGHSSTLSGRLAKLEIRLRLGRRRVVAVDNALEILMGEGRKLKY